METRGMHKTIIHDIGNAFSCSSQIPATLPLHYHSEFELIYIDKGQGQEFVNDSVKRYNTGDLTLIGKNIPHLHLCDSVTNKNISEKTICKILYFPSSIFPEDMGHMHEFAYINQILNKSIHGIRFNSESIRQYTLGIIQNIIDGNEINRIILLYELLNTLGKSKEISLISYVNDIGQTRRYKECDLTTRIIGYINKNFQNKLSLKDIAESVQMLPMSACRYFKQKTNKTIFEYINEVRINKACRLLTDSDLSISEIAFQSGYIPLQ